MTYLKCFNFAFLRAELLTPRGLRLGEGLDARLELVNLLPPLIELLAHVAQLLGELRFGVFNALIEDALDLAQLLQTRDEVVVEDAEVGEGLCFGLAILLL